MGFRVRLVIQPARNVTAVLVGIAQHKGHAVGIVIQVKPVVMGFFFGGCVAGDVTCKIVIVVRKLIGRCDEGYILTQHDRIEFNRTVVIRNRLTIIQHRFCLRVNRVKVQSAVEDRCCFAAGLIIIW